MGLTLSDLGTHCELREIYGLCPSHPILQLEKLSPNSLTLVIDDRHKEGDGPQDWPIHVLDKWLSFRILKRLSSPPTPSAPQPPAH